MAANDSERPVPDPASPEAAARERRAARAQREEAARRRRDQAHAMKLAGASYREIATALGVGRQQAWNDVERSRAELAEMDAGPLRHKQDLLWQRAERILRAIWPDVLRGDPKAAREATRLLERQARLIGADAPMRIAAHVQTEEINPMGILERAAVLARLTTDERKALRAIKLVAGPDGAPDLTALTTEQLRLLKKVGDMKLLANTTHLTAPPNANAATVIDVEAVPADEKN